jgi:NhaA family Na+:H+ antiporter
VAWLGGIGFTMSLFIAGLAFGGAEQQLTAAKLGTFLASLIAGLVGWVYLRSSATARPAVSTGRSVV